jgi:hypothetical protein
MFNSHPIRGEAFHGLISILGKSYALGVSWEGQETSLYIDEKLKDVLHGREEEVQKVCRTKIAFSNANGKAMQTAGKADVFIPMFTDWLVRLFKVHLICKATSSA